MTPELLVRHGPIEVLHLAPEGAGDDLAISFASIGHDPSRPPSPEFLGTAIGRGTRGPGRRALFIQDADRSWGTAPEFATALHEAMDILAARAPIARIALMGMSMGACMALRASHLIAADAVLAFGPQWSLSPAIFPGETRWQPWSRALAGHAPLGCLPPDVTAIGLIVHGGRDDMDHALAYPTSPAVDHLILPDQDHSGLVAHLKARGSLPGLIEAALAADRRRMLRILASAGGINRRRLASRP